jgi:hypothetical protein
LKVDTCHGDGCQLARGDGVFDGHRAEDGWTGARYCGDPDGCVAGEGLGGLDWLGGGTEEQGRDAQTSGGVDRHLASERLTLVKQLPAKAHYPPLTTVEQELDDGNRVGDDRPLEDVRQGLRQSVSRCAGIDRDGVRDRDESGRRSRSLGWVANDENEENRP